MAEQQAPDKKKYWLDEKRNVDKIWYALIGVCVLSVIADLFYHKHVKFAVEDFVPGMYGYFAALAGVVLVFGARVFRKIVKRREDYYSEADDA